MKQLKNIFLFLSAFVPMFVLMLIKLVIDMINHNLSLNILNMLNLSTLIILILTGIAGLYCNFHDKHTATKVIVVSAQNITDKHFFGYFSLFVLFALQMDVSMVSEYCTFVLIMIFIAIVYIKNALFYINPLLNLLGYNFFDVTYTLHNESKPHHAKIFYRGHLKAGATYFANVKNNNFTFIYKKNKTSST